MPKASPAYTSFNAGEWTPLLEGRPDLEKYFNACRRMVNFIPKIQGPATRRPGTPHVAAAKDSDHFTRLVPFEFSVTQAYILEFGHLYLRFYRDNGRIEDGGNPVEVATPYTEDDLPRLKFVQSADVLYLFHPDFMPRKLSRTSHVAWTLTAIDPLDGPYLSTNTTSTTLNPSATSGSITIAASSTTGINGGQGFLATDVGRLVRIKHGSTWGWAEITAINSTTSVNATVRGNFGNDSATTDWRLGLYCRTSGFPSCGTFYEDRLVLAGVPEFPQRLDLSRTGDYENFAPTETDGTVVSDNALVFTLNANDVNAIRWVLDDEKGLLVGTVGGEWVLRPAAQNEALDAANLPQARRATTWGSADIQPLKAGNAVIFVQRARRKLMETAYFFEDDGFRSGDLTELAEHITKSGILAMAYQKEPDSILWTVRTDGILLGLTYRREQSVVGWHRHVLGGEDARVESIAVIPSADGSRDELWMVVKRVVRQRDVRYVEYMEAPLAHDGDQADAFYVDSGLSYNGEPTDTLAGLDHLDGETVQILADGGAHPDRVVIDGTIVLAREASKAHVGLAYDHLSELQTLNVEAGAADGTAQGKTKRITRVASRWHRSLGARMGPDAEDFDPIPELMFRDPVTPMGTPDPLYSGDAAMSWPGGYETEGRITVKPSGPFPLTLLGLYPQLITQDR